MKWIATILIALSAAWPAQARGGHFHGSCGPRFYGYFVYPFPPAYGVYYDYDPGYQFSPAPTVSAPVAVVTQESSPVFRSGYLWGMDRRLRLVTKRQTRRMLQSYWPNAPQSIRDEFRRGFAAGYGAAGETEFDQLLTKAGLTR
jgi:hypothetical protein